ncbi:MAG: sensor histidine kinase [Bacteroidota bacterium]
MSAIFLILASIGYLGLLFGIAYFSERLETRNPRLVNNPYTYALSLAVYCTAWTFYGSVGRAAYSGIEFLAIYIGPSLMAPLWYFMLRKIILIVRHQQINSIADFISSRYGKSTFLGGLVTIMALFFIIPYISLQLKAISSSFSLLIDRTSSLGASLDGRSLLGDPAFYAAMILAAFTILFGIRHLETTQKHSGLVAAISFESVIKLFAFWAVGVFVCWGIFESPTQLFEQANSHEEIAALFRFDATATVNPLTWVVLIVLSMATIVCLPRQFHISVIENQNPAHVNKAIWLFPMYLFLINLFVLPIAVGGRLMFSGQGVDADTFVLSLPLLEGQTELAFVVFIGGLSAASSMVIVSVTALSIMSSNNLLMPWLVRTRTVREGLEVDLSDRLIHIRRILTFIIMLLAYVYFITLGQKAPLVSTGLISFVGVAQFAPVILGALYWKDGTKRAATSALLVGFAVWAFTLPFAALADAGVLSEGIHQEGLWGLSILKPYALFGLEGLDPISHATFWSLLLNSLTYLIVSQFSQPSALEQKQANLFVQIHRYIAEPKEATMWRGKAFLRDLKPLLARFLGEERSYQIVQEYSISNGLDLENITEVKAEFVERVETALAGAVGAASARLLIASAVKEETLDASEIMFALDETKEVMQYSKELEEKQAELETTYKQLQQANGRLQAMDQLRNEFLRTVTHELRTPITSIRSMAQIVHENPDLPLSKRAEFLGIVVKESERLSRLINEVLDLEKMEAGHAKMNLQRLDMVEVISTSVERLTPLVQAKNQQLRWKAPNDPIWIMGDRDRMIQVVINLLSNAIKFSPAEKGIVHLELKIRKDQVRFLVRDNGKGISGEALPYIFDKFTQFNSTREQEKGSGLGLSICWRIVYLHQGKIWVESTLGQGASFWVELPHMKNSL